MEWDANGPDQLASHSLSPLTVRSWPRYITAQTESAPRANTVNRSTSHRFCDRIPCFRVIRYGICALPTKIASLAGEASGVAWYHQEQCC